MTRGTRRRDRWTLAGLALVLVGPPAVAWAAPAVPLEPLARHTAATGTLVALALALLALVVRGERRPLASAGVRAPRRWTLGWAALLVAFNALVVAPLMDAALTRAGARGFGPAVRAFGALPMWYRVAVVLVIPPIEDLFYRGYAIERLSELLRSPAAAVVLSSAAFALAHIPSAGVGVGLALVLPAVVGGAFYAWRRDLAALALAHVVTDLLGFFVWSPSS